ncbi:MAG: acyl-[acyl-carrier-protein]--UDP-N-acetylglucosamine O-acyltransferase [Verrucomicrobia bacterium RIFCSPLOWO2_12_FULL_64_8]|nr:MAG: acyl-[acyl-carrier-protein]--UDP-N-acetylglucosamine O-acyltransferase [Verrucomicrobia bacterium RIFCSPLOWO2_12_FULL_64_8]
MSPQIHATAIVESTAQLGAGVVIGAFAYVGGNAIVGDGTVVHHHATVEGQTILGRECEIYPYACIGAKTQDLKHRGGAPGVRIGDCNVFREHVTVHAATDDGRFTVVGSNNYILAYSHVAHDCVLGNHIVMSNSISLAGHVVVEDYVTIGGAAGGHQFCRLGTHAMLGAMSKLVQDLPPYLIADGHPAVIRSINKIGLERNKFTPEAIDRVKQAYKILYREGLHRRQAMERMQEHPLASSEEFQRMLAFATATERGLVPGN